VHTANQTLYKLRAVENYLSYHVLQKMRRLVMLLKLRSPKFLFKF